MNEPIELPVRHADRVPMRTTVEDDLRLAGKRPVNDHGLSVEGAEWRHRPDLAVAVQLCQLGLPREPDRLRMKDLLQPLEVHRPRRRQNGEDGLSISNTADGFRPFVARDVRHGGLLLRRVRRRVQQHRIARVVPIEIIGN